VVFTPNGDGVVSAGWDGSHRFWDAASQQEPWSDHHNGKEISHVEYSPDGRYLAACGLGIVSVYNVSTREKLWTINDELSSRPGENINYITNSAF
jgi:WD40 repeat protein